MITRRLAGIALSYEHDELPAAVRAMAHRCILDATACALAGIGERPAVLVREQVLAEGGTPEAAMLGSDALLPAGQAALANGTAAHVLDYDDVNVAIPGHATAVVMPAVLALGQAIGAGGRDVLAAFVAGYEIACRVGLLVAPGHYDRGFHATATTGVIGAAAGCARLLRLSAPQAAHALSLAATQASGLKAMFANMGKPLHAGLAARNAVFAARLAARGLESGSDALEHPQGFARTSSPDFHPEAALDESGDFHILRNLFKYHAACYGVHSAIECASLIRREHGLQAAAIARVRVTSHPASEKYCNIAAPATGAEGKFSLRLNTALGFLGRDTSRLDSYSDASVAEPEAVALRDRVSVGYESELAMMQSRVEVETVHGERFSATCDAGEPETDVEIQAARVAAKFTALAVPALGEERAARLMRKILDVDQLMAGGGPFTLR